MLEDITQIQTEISAIQSQIAALSPAAPAPPIAAQPSSAPSFSQALAAAQASSNPSIGNGVSVPPASLGPLPPLPVSPSSGAVTPLPAVSTIGADVDGLIQTSAAANGVDPALVRAVIQTESGGNPKAVSSAGAMGLMQLMPSNVQEAGVTNPFDPAQNIAAGTQQLAALLKQYHGDVTLALAAYNAGPGNVQKYGGVPPFPETQNYIRKVRAAMVKE